MRVLLLALFAMLCFTSKAQFPSFVNTEGKKFHVDSSEVTKKFRNHFNEEMDSIESYSAASMSSFFKLRTEMLQDSINIVREKISLISEIKNEEIIELENERKCICGNQNKEDCKKSEKSCDEIKKQLANLKIELLQQKKFKDEYKTMVAFNDRLIILQKDFSLAKKTSKYFESVNKFSGEPKLIAGFFPIAFDPEKSTFFFQDSDSKHIDVLSNFVLQSNIEKNAIYSDLISGMLWVFKTDISTTLVDNSAINDGQEQIENKVAYGGLLNISFEYPLFIKSNEHFSIYIPIEKRLSFDRLKINETVDDNELLFFGEIAPSIYLKFPLRETSIDDNVSIFGNSKLSQTYGNSNFFDGIEYDSDPFVYCQSQVGIEVDNKIRFAVNIPTYSSNDDLIENQNVTVGLQFDPKLFNNTKKNK